MSLVDFSRVVAVAYDIRQRVGKKGTYYSARTVIETCYPDVMVTGAALPPGIAEVVEVRGGQKTIFYNRRINPMAQRVAIAHGLAHIIFDLGTVERRECLRESERMATSRVERRADLFAGELLAPLDEIDEHFDDDLFPRDPALRQHFDDEVDHIASTFHVPPGFPALAAVRPGVAEKDELRGDRKEVT